MRAASHFEEEKKDVALQFNTVALQLDTEEEWFTIKKTEEEERKQRRNANAERRAKRMRGESASSDETSRTPSIASSAKSQRIHELEEKYERILLSMGVTLTSTT